MSIPLLLIYNFTKIALLGLTHFFGTVSHICFKCARMALRATFSISRKKRGKSELTSLLIVFSLRVNWKLFTVNLLG